MFQAHLGQALMTSFPKPHPLHFSSHIHDILNYIYSAMMVINFTAKETKLKNILQYNFI